jgi:hypothetical protein
LTGMSDNMHKEVIIEWMTKHKRSDYCMLIWSAAIVRVKVKSASIKKKRKY